MWFLQLWESLALDILKVDSSENWVQKFLISIRHNYDDQILPIVIKIDSCVMNGLFCQWQVLRQYCNLLFLILFFLILILIPSLNKIPRQWLSIINIQSQGIQFRVISHWKRIEISRVNPKYFRNSWIIGQFQRVSKYLRVHYRMHISQAYTHVLRCTRLAEFTLGRAAFEPELSDYGWYFGHELFSDFVRFIGEQLGRIYPGKYLDIIMRITLASAK